MDNPRNAHVHACMTCENKAAPLECYRIYLCTAFVCVSLFLFRICQQYHTAQQLRMAKSYSNYKYENENTDTQSEFQLMSCCMCELWAHTHTVHVQYVCICGRKAELIRCMSNKYDYL